MARMTAKEFTDKYTNRLKGSVTEIAAGIDRVETAPTHLAANKKQKMLMGVTEAVNSGKWERGLRAVSLEDWKKAAKEKGVGRIAAGVDGAQGKMEKFAGQLLTYQDGLGKTVAAMPDNTQDDRINKAVAWMRGMAKFKPTS